MALREEYTRSGNRSALSQRFWGADMHYEVADLTWFKQAGMIGPFKSEKAAFSDRKFTNYPIVAVTDFDKNPGDRMTLPFFNQFETDDATTGAVYYGTDTLVDNEQNFNFKNVDIYINLERTGAAWLGKMSEIRGGHNMKELGSEGLKLWQVQRHDDAIFDALYSGHNLATTSSATGALAISTITHPNIYPAGDATSIAELDSGDVLNAAYLENLQVEANVKNIPKCKFKGYDDVWPLLIHSYQWRTLRADSAYKSEIAQGDLRGADNRLFSNAVGMYAGILVMVVPGLNKIKTATGAEAGQKASNIRKAILLGANSAFYAVKQGDSRIIPRLENDYENKNGLAIQSVLGCAAAHWISDDGNSTYTNQSSILCPTWAQNPKSAAA
mgnify:FL=1